MPPDNPYDALFTPTNPRDRVHGVASKIGISPDIADDYLKVTKVESGHNVNVGNSAKGAQGFGQVMPDRPGLSVRTISGRRYNLQNPDENVEAGLRLFSAGGNDPVGRRLEYFGGAGARRRYERTGRIPNISDGNLTAQQYVQATGGQQSPKPTPNPYDALFSSAESQAPSEPSEQVRQTGQPGAPTPEMQPPGANGAQPPPPEIRGGLAPENAAWHAAWHFGPMDGESLTRRQVRVLAEAVAEDERKKAAGEQVGEPSIEYQNEMRKRAGMAPLKYNVNITPLQVGSIRLNVPFTEKARAPYFRPDTQPAPLPVGPRKIVTNAEKPFSLEGDRSENEIRRRIIAKPDLYTGEEYRNFLLMNRSRDSDTQRQAFVDLKLKQQIAPAGSARNILVGEEVEQGRQQRVARMTGAKGWAQYLSQVPKSAALGVTDTFATMMKSIAVGAMKLDDVTGLKEYAGKETTDLATYQLGEYIQREARNILGSNADLEQETLVGQTPQTIGQVASFVLGGWATKAPKLATVILGVGMTTGDAYDEVRVAGGTDEQAVNAGLLAGALLGPTELIGMNGAMHAITDATAKQTWRLALKKALKEGSRDIVENVLQEMGQEWGQGEITGKRRTGKEVLTAGLQGAVGGGVTIPTSLIAHRPIKEARPIEPSADVVDKANETPITLHENGNRPFAAEAPETIHAQMDALVNGRGNRYGVLIPKGQSAPTRIPKGFMTTRTDEGVVIHPKELSSDDVRELVDGGNSWRLLGHQNPEGPEATRIVIARAGIEREGGIKPGTELLSSYVVPGQEQNAIEEMRAQFAPYEPTFEVGRKETAANTVVAREAQNEVHQAQPTVEAQDRTISQAGQGARAEVPSSTNAQTGERALGPVPVESKRDDSGVPIAPQRFSTVTPAEQQPSTAGGEAGGVNPTTLSAEEQAAYQKQYDELFSPTPHHSDRQKRRRRGEGKGQFVPGFREQQIEVPKELATPPQVSAQNITRTITTPTPPRDFAYFKSQGLSNAEAARRAAKSLSEGPATEHAVTRPAELKTQPTATEARSVYRSLERVPPERAEVEGRRLGKGHAKPTHDVDKTLAALRYKEIEAETKSVTDPATMRELVREQSAILRQYPDLSKEDLTYREVDTAGLYADETLESNQGRFKGFESARIELPRPPAEMTLDVSTNKGFRELLEAKKAAISKGGNYPEELRQELISRGYEAVRGGGVGQTEPNEIVLLNEPNPPVTPAPEPAKLAATESQLTTRKEVKDVTQEAAVVPGQSGNRSIAGERKSEPAQLTRLEAASEYSPAVQQAFKDWNERRAYVGGGGNYRVRAEAATPTHRPSGKIAKWNKEVKHLFPSSAEFHVAAKEFEKQQPKPVSREDGEPLFMLRKVGQSVWDTLRKWLDIGHHSVKREGNVIVMGDAAHTALLIADDELSINFGGGFFTAAEARALLDHTGKESRIHRVQPGMVTDLEKLRRSVQEALDEGHSGIVISSPEAARHENFHASSFSIGAESPLNERHKDLSVLTETPEYQIGARHLLGLHYGNNTPLLVEEMAARIADGKHNELGLTRKQAIDWMAKWFTSFADTHGATRISQFQELAKDAQKALATAIDAQATKGESTGVDEDVRRLEEGRESRAGPSDSDARLFDLKRGREKQVEQVKTETEVLAAIDHEVSQTDEFNHWLADLLENDQQEIAQAKNDDDLRRGYVEDFIRDEHSIRIREDGLIEIYRLDDATREIVGDHQIVVYHHTSDKVLKSIRERGLAPRVGTAANPHLNTGAGVYVTSETSGPAVAGYQRNATQAHGGNAVTLVIKTKVDDLVSDPDDADIKSGETQWILPHVESADIVEVLRGSTSTPLFSLSPPKRRSKDALERLKELAKARGQTLREAPAKTIVAENIDSSETKKEASKITGFTTSQGSTYTISGESTQRTKTPHVGHDPKDVGLKRLSDRTVYLDEEEAREVGMWNTLNASGKRIIVHGDEVWLTSMNPKENKRGRDGRFKFSTEPEVGKSPLELWDRSESLNKEGREGYRGNHPGTPIKSLSTETTRSPLTIVPPPERHSAEVRERSFPKTAETAGFQGGSDRDYSVLTNTKSVELAKKQIARVGVDRAAADLAHTEDVGAPEIATGILLMQHYEQNGDISGAVNVAGDVARKLTQAGQTAQAASLISRLSPEGVLLHAQKILKGKPLAEEAAKTLVAQAKAVSDAEKLIAEIQKQRPDVFGPNGDILPRPSKSPRTTSESRTAAPRSARAKIGTLQDRLVSLEQQARERMQARAATAKAEAATLPPRGQRGAGVSPAGVAADLGDLVIIGAAKLARKGMTQSVWLAEMAHEATALTRKDLHRLYRESYERYQQERRQFQRESRMRGAERQARGEKGTIEGPPTPAELREQGPLSPQEYRQIIAERAEAQKLAQRSYRELARTYQNLTRGRLQKIADTAVGLRRANLLTAVKTHLRNITSNVGFTIISEETARPMSALADMVARRTKGTGLRTTAGLSIPSASKALYAAAVKEGPRRAVDIILGREVLPLEGYRSGAEGIASKMQLHEADSGFKILDTYINTVFRTLEAEDALFKVYAFRRELADIALSQARSERANGANIAVSQRAKELQSNPTDAMQMEAATYADYATFQNKNVVSSGISAFKRFTEPVGGKFLVEQIAPFDRTPTNIIARALENSPLGLISAARKYKRIGTQAQTVADAISKAAFTRQEQKDFARTFGRASTGTMIAALAMVLAAKGLLSGAADYDSDREDSDREDYMKKRRKYGGGGMLRIPGTNQRVSIVDTPVGKSMATAASMYEQMKDPENTWGEAVTKSGRAALNTYLLDQPLIRGLRDLGDTKSVGEAAAQYGTTFIPGSQALKSISEVADNQPRIYRGQGAAAQFRTLIPGRYGRGGLPIDSGVDAEERGGLGRRSLRALDPFNTTTEGHGPRKRSESAGEGGWPMQKELDRLDITANAPQRIKPSKNEKFKAETEEEYDARRHQEAEAIKVALQLLEGVDSYRVLPDRSKEAAIRATITAARESVRYGAPAKRRQMEDHP